MSDHLQAFVNAQFKHFINGNLVAGAYDNVEGMRESFEEGITEAFNEFIQEEVSMKHLLANHLAQHDAMDSKDHLLERLAYWVNEEGPESEEEREEQIIGINMLLGEFE